MPVKERIIEQAAHLLATDEQATVEDIARAAGVSRATFYRAVGSRADLLAELKLEPEIDTRRRILDAASSLLLQQTLDQLSMDELASKAAVSRANLYRLFPGKAALFRGLLVAFTPFEPVMTFLDQHGEEPPERLIPELAVTAYRAVIGHTGLARTLVLEVTARRPESQQAFAETGLRAMQRLATYLQSQMDSGRLRAMPPVLALQGLIGAVMLHVLATPLLTPLGTAAPSGEHAVRALARVWLEGVLPR